ncbi:hypothetical protein ACQK5W_09720 [Pantoea sp. FN060301]|uniref:hypothetical protein n=1 Tax=Pantoea sp. FN060301 TaxID=3420380 RepID=UPI003D17C228
MVKIICLLGSCLLLSGCVLKHYPASPPIDDLQASQLDCGGVQQEIARQRDVDAQIDKTGEFDGLTVLAFMGDFGIGNGVAKGLARKHATARSAQLSSLAQQKCASGSVAAISASPS